MLGVSSAAARPRKLDSRFHPDIAVPPVPGLRSVGTIASSSRNLAPGRIRSASVYPSSTSRNAASAFSSARRNTQLGRTTQDALAALKHGTKAMSGSVLRTTSPMTMASTGRESFRSAVSAAHGLDVAGHAQLIGDLHQVIFRDLIRLGDLGNGRQTVIFQCEIRQESQRIIRIDR